MDKKHQTSWQKVSLKYLLSRRYLFVQSGVKGATRVGLSGFYLWE